MEMARFALSMHFISSIFDNQVFHDNVKRKKLLRDRQLVDLSLVLGSVGSADSICGPSVLFETTDHSA